jgi:hypothetical protein
MKPSRSYPQVMKRWYRPAERVCPECQRTLREALTLTRRTVITLQGVIKLTHAGYRCPERQCPGHQRTYRSAEADALALPHMTYGLDIVLLVGRLRLREHRTVDEVHQELLGRLEPLGVKIARREILYLFEAYCTLLKASSEAKDDHPWLAQVEKNGGIIVSVDGIQPEKGNETVYLVRGYRELFAPCSPLGEGNARGFYVSLVQMLYLHLLLAHTLPFNYRLKHEGRRQFLCYP